MFLIGSLSLVFPFLLNFSADDGSAFSLNVDAWSSTFLSLIVGVGFLILPYIWGYFQSPRDRLRFLLAFVPFGLAMTGVVLFNHFVLFFICWELTTLFSFYLISFYGAEEQSRKSALVTLLITGAGGLCLLGALLLLGLESDIWHFSELSQIQWEQLPHGKWILALIVIAAMTKSAQFPFHFWLPAAMTAPTPASAYLHSATMVKAGVFLLYRFSEPLTQFPDLAQLVLWSGLITFSWGALISIYQNDLKSVLAGTTLSQLGLMAALCTLPFPGAREALISLILAHGLYKAGLFLFVGVVDHAFHTRKLSSLQVLNVQSRSLFYLGLLLALALLGLPGSLGFIAKSSMKWSLSQTPSTDWIYLFVGLLGTAGGLRAAVGIWNHRMSGNNSGINSSNSEEAHFYDPKWILIVPPVLLGVLSFTPILFAFFPTDPFPPTSLWWENLNATKLMVLAVTSVASIFIARQAIREELGTKIPSAVALFLKAWEGLLRFANRLTYLLQNGNLAFYQSLILVCTLVGFAFVGWQLPWAHSQLWSSLDLDFNLLAVLLFLFVIQIGAALMLLVSNQVLYSILFLGLSGVPLACVFAILGAPDLALTQISVETLSVFLFAFTLRGITLNARKPLSRASKWSKGILATSTAGAISLCVLWASQYQAPSRLRDFFAESSWLLAHGKNVVNVILVDFRGLDTLGEITVLVIAALGIWTLLVRRSST